MIVCSMNSVYAKAQKEMVFFYADDTLFLRRDVFERVCVLRVCVFVTVWKKPGEARAATKGETRPKITTVQWRKL